MKSPETVLKNESYIIYPCHSINVVNQLNHLKKNGSSFGEPLILNYPWGIAVVVRHLKGLFMMIPHLKNHLFDKSSLVESSGIGQKCRHQYLHL